MKQIPEYIVVRFSIPEPVACELFTLYTLQTTTRGDAKTADGAIQTASDGWFARFQIDAESASELVRLGLVIEKPNEPNWIKVEEETKKQIDDILSHLP